MKINHELVQYLCHLSRLQINESEEDQILKDLNKILQLIEKLNEVDTKNVAPLIYVNEHHLPLREDNTANGLPAKSVLKNAPASKADFFSVPKVINSET